MFRPILKSKKKLLCYTELSNYVTQKELKKVTNVDTSRFALKTNVAEIKKRG